MEYLIIIAYTALCYFLGFSVGRLSPRANKVDPRAIGRATDLNTYMIQRAIELSKGGK